MKGSKNIFILFNSGIKRGYSVLYKSVHTGVQTYHKAIQLIKQKLNKNPKGVFLLRISYFYIAKVKAPELKANYENDKNII